MYLEPHRVSRIEALHYSEGTVVVITTAVHEYLVTVGDARVSIATGRFPLSDWDVLVFCFAHGVNLHPLTRCCEEQVQSE